MRHNVCKDSLKPCRYAALLILILLLAGCKPSTTTPPGMVHVDKGEFIMGSDQIDKEAKGLQYGFTRPLYANEHPRHNVMLDGFYIDTTEVTNGKYKEFVAATGRKPPIYWAEPTYIEIEDKMSAYPVTYVTWHDADAYCKWRKKRLPTEKEWEKTARGTDGREFPWGDEFDIKKANALGEYGGLGPAGKFPEGTSPYGAVDMAGNVWEWTADWYKQYPGGDFSDEDYGEKFKVVRGGGWGGVGHYSLQIYVRTSYRNVAPPDRGFDDLGFRCARSE